MLEGIKTPEVQKSVAHTIFDPEEVIPVIPLPEPEMIAIASPAAALPEPEVVLRAPASSDEFQTYTVQADDNLEYISGQLLGKRSDWRKLQKWNPTVLANPARLSIGMVIKYQNSAKIELAQVEEPVVLSMVPTQGPEIVAIVPLTPSSSDEFQTYTIQADDNLGYIALQLLGKRTDWRKLQKWNPTVLANPGAISEGMIIKYQNSAKVEPRVSLPIPDAQYLTYIVQKNDSLAKISAKLFGDESKWRDLQQWNSGLIKNTFLITRGMEIRYQFQSPQRQPAHLHEKNLKLKIYQNR